MTTHDGAEVLQWGELAEIRPATFVGDVLRYIARKSGLFPPPMIPAHYSARGGRNAVRIGASRVPFTIDVLGPKPPRIEVFE